MNLLCPYCLGKDIVRMDSGYVCQRTRLAISRYYVENPEISKAVISIVGFRGHGKTVFLTALFSALYKLAGIWPGFFTMALDGNSLDTLKKALFNLEKGSLPDPTPKMFPMPTVIEASNIPRFKKWFLFFYDTGGESFEKAINLIEYGKFITGSITVTFLVSVSELEQNGFSMYELLNIYINGLKELNGSTQKQHLIVVLTKADRLNDMLMHGWEGIWNYLTNGGLERLRQVNMVHYLNEMKGISESLKDSLRSNLEIHQFIHLAEHNFKSVEYCIVSSLGSEPNGNKLTTGLNPKRILDPIFWVFEKSRSRSLLTQFFDN